VVDSTRDSNHPATAAVDADFELLEQWRAGDKRAGEDLFRRHFASVLRFFNNKAARSAEDLTQQTFLECVGARDRFRGASSFRSYLFAIAWNQLRHYFRREKRNEHLDFEASSVNELVASLSSPSSKLDRAQRGQRIHDALVRLPLAQQVLLECHYWQDLDATALSDVLGVPAGTIRVRLLRARSALRAELARLKPTTNSGSDDADDPLSVSLEQLEAEDRQLACSSS
jgi:RNA polymerase sigma factor (sigma-70 family)